MPGQEGSGLSADKTPVSYTPARIAPPILGPMLEPNRCLLATALPLHHDLLPGHRLAGAPVSAGSVPLAEIGGCAIGVWEISPGTSTDVEADEVFVVLSGAATVRFHDGTPDLHLAAGSVGRLARGSATTWIVTETLRKIWIAA